MRTKYNWSQLKVDYFKSKIMDVKEYFETTLSLYNPYITEMTTWRKDEKLEMLKGAKDEAMIQLKKEMAEVYKPSAKEMWNLHQLLIWIATRKILKWAKDTAPVDKDWNVLPENEDNLDRLYLSDLERLRKIVKTEKNEPTTVSQVDWTLWSKNEYNIVVDSSLSDIISPNDKISI
jgi:hypothetical protein